MAALARGDAERLLRFVAEAESIGGDEPFTPDLLAELGRLVHADDVTTASSIACVGGDLLVGRRDDGGHDVELDDETRWRVLLEEHPLCLRQQEGHFGAVKLSDFLNQRELHRTWVYDNFLAPFHVEYELEVSIPSPLWHTKTFLFGRSGGRDFSERDRLLLDLLQPHLARIWLAARTHRLSRRWPSSTALTSTTLAE